MKFCAIVVLVAASVLASQADAATWYVSPCGNDGWVGVQGACAAPFGPKRTIQAGIDVAEDGDTVIVLPGVYVETVDLNGKAIHLLGQGGAGVTTINGGGSGPVVSCNSLEGPGTVIEGFTITNGQAVAGGGMILALSSPEIIDCVFLLNSASEEGGGVAGYFASPTFTGCVFYDNVAAMPAFHVYGGGAYFRGGSPALIGCEFTYNDVVGNGGALFIGPDADATVEDCTFTDNTASRHPGAIGWAAGGAVCVDSATLAIQDSTFEDNDAFGDGGALSVRYFSDVSVSSTAFLTNRSLESRGGAIDVRMSSLSVFAGSFTGNVVASAADPTRGGGAIFAESSEVSVVLSGFSGNQVMTGMDGTNGADGGAICAREAHVSLQASTFFENETMSHGGAVSAGGDSGELAMSGCVFTSNRSESFGGAVYTTDISVSAEACTFIDNLSWGSGGGMRASLDPDDAATVEACSFTANTGLNGGGLSIDGGTATVSASDFEQNTAHNTGGGASFTDTVLSTVRDTSFLDNTCAGGGGGLGIGSLVYVVGSEFSGNHAQYGGGAASLSTDGEGVYIGCLFDGNSSDSGGGAIAVTTGSEARVINTLVVNNESPLGRGAILTSAPLPGGSGSEELSILNSTVAHNIGGGVFIDNDPSNTEISNSVVWGNTMGDALEGDAPAVTHSLIEGGAPGTGNIDADPQFVNPLLGNYRLADGSPCVDSGLNAAVALDEADLDSDLLTGETVPYDLDGEARMMSVGGCSGLVTVDMGAYEALGLTEIHLGDLDGDGVVAAGDLAVLLAAWGPCGACCPADYNGDGMVDSTDLAVLLASWD